MRIKLMFAVLSVVIGFALFGITVAHAQTTGNVGNQDAIDVNDVSFLWPAPAKKEDTDALISLSDFLADGASPILPKNAFDALLAAALQVQVNDSAMRPKQIIFGQFEAQFRQPKNWKIAAVRIDPSAPGTSPDLATKIGVLPQIRLIAQPVTVDNGVVTIHDTTAHLVFSYVINAKPPFQPDKQTFTEIVNDVRALKQFLKEKSVPTAGPLGIHPGLRTPVPGFPDKVRMLLRKHLNEKRLTAMAFMGVQRSEPWIFFSMDRNTGTWAPSKNPIIGGPAQMLIMSSGDRVRPGPSPANIDGKKGVSTSLLFDPKINQTLDQLVFADVPNLKLKDIPDLIANPRLAHFFNTDCISCHTESTRRSLLSLDNYKSTFRFSIPAGISGLDTSVANRGLWNVRNFGWGDTAGISTVTQRTANEAAESAAFINSNYGRKPMSEAVSHPLTLVMTIKGDKEFKELKAMLEGMQGDPKNEILAALDRIGTVHFARFVFLDDRHLAVITTFDNDFDKYIDTFIDEIGPVFDKLLARMDKAPPLPVSKNRKEFLAYVKTNDRPVVSFYSAYPDLSVGDILTLRLKQQEKK